MAHYRRQTAYYNVGGGLDWGRREGEGYMRRGGGDKKGRGVGHLQRYRGI
jgi:hypothetical protein